MTTNVVLITPPLILFVSVSRHARHGLARSSADGLTGCNLGSPGLCSHLQAQLRKDVLPTPAGCQQDSIPVPVDCMAAALLKPQENLSLDLTLLCKDAGVLHNCRVMPSTHVILCDLEASHSLHHSQEEQIIQVITHWGSL